MKMEKECKHDEKYARKNDDEQDLCNPAMKIDWRKRMDMQE